MLLVLQHEQQIMLLDLLLLEHLLMLNKVQLMPMLVGCVQMIVLDLLILSVRLLWCLYSFPVPVLLLLEPG
jgi:hypothetical protein